MFRVRPVGWFHVPGSPLTWAVAAVMALFCLNVFLAIDRHSHSASDTLYGIFPYWAVVFLLWNWFAAKCSDARTPGSSELHGPEAQRIGDDAD